MATDKCVTKANIQLVLFDIGNVMIRLCDDWSQACTLTGVRDITATLLDPAARKQIEQWMIDHESGHDTIEQFTQQLAELFNINLVEAHALHDVWLRTAFDGIEELIDDIHQARCQTGCLSNTNDNHWAIMFGDGPSRLPMHKLDHHFASHLIGTMKPAPGIYQYVESQTNLPTEAMVFFDDKPENIAAARERGWQALTIERDGDPVSQMRTHLTRLGLLECPAC